MTWGELIAYTQNVVEQAAVQCGIEKPDRLLKGGRFKSLNIAAARLRGLYRQAMRGKSRKAAIRCHCLMCCGWQQTEVEACTAPGCPLYPYRRSFANPVDKRHELGAESPGRGQVV